MFVWVKRKEWERGERQIKFRERTMERLGLPWGLIRGSLRRREGEVRDSVSHQ